MGQIFQTQLLFWPSRARDKCNFESSFALFKAKCERPSQQESTEKCRQSLLSDKV